MTWVLFLDSGFNVIMHIQVKTLHLKLHCRIKYFGLIQSTFYIRRIQSTNLSILEVFAFYKQAHGVLQYCASSMTQAVW